MSDRTVHAISANGNEIVRYDRAGKWYVEKPGVMRKAITVSAAVDLATQPGARHFIGRPGGGIFDTRVIRKLAA